MSNKDNSLNFTQLMGFIPTLLIDNLKDLKNNPLDPRRCSNDKIRKLRSEHWAVVMFGDISGYSNLCMALEKNKQVDASERIAFLINGQLDQLCKIVMKQGGDIFKFAGDAIIVLFIIKRKEGHLDPASDEKLLTLRRVIQCSLEIQEKLHMTRLTKDVELSIKIGISMGQVDIINIGGVQDRSEQVPIGEALMEAFDCEGCCDKGDIYCSKKVKLDAQDQFQFKAHPNPKFPDFQKPTLKKEGVKQICAINSNILSKANMATQDMEYMKVELEKFIPGAALTQVKNNQDKFANQLRHIVVLFISLGIDLKDVNPESMNMQFKNIQKITQKQQGSINKFLMDDKGSTLIICFGLPKTSQLDGPERSLQCSFELYKQFKEINKSIQIGASIGQNYSGIVGTSGNRREYSVLGEAVNLSARLMSRVKEIDYERKKIGSSTSDSSTSESSDHQIMKFPIIVDVKLYKECLHKISFTKLSQFIPKGQTDKKTPFTPDFDEIWHNNFKIHKLIKPHMETDTMLNQNFLDRESQQEDFDNFFQDFMDKNHKRNSTTWNYLISVEGKFASGKSRQVHNRILKNKIGSTESKCELQCNQINQQMRMDKIELNGFFQILSKIDKSALVLPASERRKVISNHFKEPNKSATKQSKVIVLDDCQQMDEQSFELVLEIMEHGWRNFFILIQREDSNSRKLNLMKEKLSQVQKSMERQKGLIEFKSIVIQSKIHTKFIKAQLIELAQNLSINSEDLNKIYRDKHWISLTKEELQEYDLKLYDLLHSMSYRSPIAMKDMIEYLLVENLIKVPKGQESIQYSRELQECLLLDDQCHLKIPSIIYREEMQKFDCIQTRLQELMVQRNTEGWEMDPNYFIILQVASTLGTDFNVNTVHKLLPIEIKRKELVTYLTDLCEIEYLKEFSHLEEFGFMDTWARNSVQQTLLQDSRMRYHRKYATIKTVEMEHPDDETLGNYMLLNQFNLKQKVELRRSWMYSRFNNQKDYFRDKSDYNDHMQNSIVSKDIMQKLIQKKDGSAVLQKEKLWKVSSTSFIGNSTREERIICINENCIFQNQLECLDTDDLTIQNRRLGSIPLDGIESLHMVKKMGLVGVEINANQWQKKKNLEKEKRQFLFGLEEEDMKVKEFMSSIQFIMFKSRQDQFSECFGRIHFPLNEEPAISGGQGEDPRSNNQSGLIKTQRLSLKSNSTSRLSRLSQGSITSEQNNLTMTRFKQNLVSSDDKKEELQKILDTSMSLFLSDLLSLSVHPIAKKNANNGRFNGFIRKIKDKEARNLLADPLAGVKLIKDIMFSEKNNLMMSTESPNERPTMDKLNSDRSSENLNNRLSRLSTFKNRVSDEVEIDFKGNRTSFQYTIETKTLDPFPLSNENLQRIDLKSSRSHRGGIQGILSDHQNELELDDKTELDSKLDMSENKQDEFNLNISHKKKKSNVFKESKGSKGNKIGKESAIKKDKKLPSEKKLEELMFSIGKLEKSVDGQFNTSNKKVEDKLDSLTNNILKLLSEVKQIKEAQNETNISMYANQTNGHSEKQVNGKLISELVNNSVINNEYKSISETTSQKKAEIDNLNIINYKNSNSSINSQNGIQNERSRKTKTQNNNSLNHIDASFQFTNDKNSNVFNKSEIDNSLNSKNGSPYKYQYDVNLSEKISFKDTKNTQFQSEKIKSGTTTTRKKELFNILNNTMTKKLNVDEDE